MTSSSRCFLGLCVPIIATSYLFGVVLGGQGYGGPGQGGAGGQGAGRVHANTAAVVTNTLLWWDSSAP